MPLFKKKTEPKKSKIYMPVKNSQPVKVTNRKTGFKIFKKSSSKKTTRRNSFSAVPYLRIFVLIVFVLGIFYFATIYVIKTRNNNPLENYEKEYVVGIEEIPTFPLSQFIFSNSINEPSVANFISSGNSAYRLPSDKGIDDANEYYQIELTNIGWTHILSVPMGSEEMKSGEYWAKENKGLRIYSKFNDVWYELLTLEEAQTGLSARVKKETERDLLLANQELQDLLPDFPWILKVPKEYVIAYRSADFKDYRLVDFKRIGTEERISLIPIAENNGSPLDTHLDNYIKDINKDSDFNWGVTKTTVIYQSYGRGLQGIISGAEETNEVALIVNPNDNIVYLLQSNVVENPFFEFILSNLSPQDTFKY